MTVVRNFRVHLYVTTLCLKKVPTFKFSVTFSNLNYFRNFCTTGKHMKFPTKPIRYYPPHLRHVATLPWKIKKNHFRKYLADIDKKWKHILYF